MVRERQRTPQDTPRPARRHHPLYLAAVVLHCRHDLVGQHFLHKIRVVGPGTLMRHEDYLLQTRHSSVYLLQTFCGQAHCQHAPVFRIVRPEERVVDGDAFYDCKFGGRGEGHKGVKLGV